MRTVYKIVMGLMLFNAFLTVYNPFFNTGLADHAVDYTSDPSITRYNPASPTDIMLAIFGFNNLHAWGAGSIVSLIVLAGGILVALATKNYVYIGVTLFISIVVGLYTQMSVAISGIGADISNIYVTAVITIVAIAIGLLLVFNVVDMFAPSPTR